MDRPPLNVLKINLPCSTKSIFIAVKDPNQSLDEIIQNGIADLEKEGKIFEAHQLAELWKTHQIRVREAQKDESNS